MGGGSHTVSLDGEWKLLFWPQKSVAAISPDDIAELDPGIIDTVAAEVPGNVELALESAGIVPDPRKGCNVYSLRPYEGYQWCYTRHFDMHKPARDERVRIIFHGIDCLASIYLNGLHVGEAENMFIEHSYDITDFLAPDGNNELMVILRSSVLESQKYELSYVVGRNDEQNSIRKAPSQYGWDIMPRLVSAGLWRSVELAVEAPAGIENVRWTTVAVDSKKNNATVQMVARFRLPFELYDKSYCEVELSRNGKTVAKRKKILLSHIAREQINIVNAELWWPRGYGEPALYKATVRLLDSKGNVLAEDVNNIGLRMANLDMSDINTEENPGRFCFIVNGEKIFVKGTNWTPLDASHSRDRSWVSKTMDLVIESNSNMIRCWGGNVYEDHEFFDICDANGIMVWQDFAMACSLYPNTPDFQKKIYDEVKSIVLKLRNHPSLVLWAGNNENDQSARWMKQLRAFNINPNKDVISREVIPSVLFEYDPTRPYLPSSPYYSQGLYEHGEPLEEYLPENHLWGPRGYYKAPFYNRANCLFVSEIGYHGCPSMESLCRMFDHDMVYPWTDTLNFTWNQQWIAKSVCDLPLSTKERKRNNLMINQCKALFGACPVDLEDFIFASQSVQAEAMKYFIELWRSAKFDRTGILWWNIRDGWPILSDAVCDYYFNKKRAFYYIKNVQHDVCVMVRDAVDGHYPLVAVNDTREPVSGNVVVKDIVKKKIMYRGSYEMMANGRSVLADLPLDKGQGMLLIEYTVNGKTFRNHFLYGEPPFALEDYKQWIKEIGIYD